MDIIETLLLILLVACAVGAAAMAVALVLDLLIEYRHGPYFRPPSRRMIARGGIDILDDSEQPMDIFRPHLDSKEETG